MQPQGTSLQKAIQLIMMLRAMEGEGQPSQPQGSNRIADLAKTAKDGKEMIDVIKGIGGFGGGGAAASAAGTGATAGTGVAAAMPSTLGGYTSLSGMGSGAATTGAGSTMASVGSVALPVAAVAAALNNAWETGGKDILRGRGDRADWTNQGVNMLTGGAPNIALRLLGKRSVGAMMKSGKSDDQMQRDDFRGFMKQSGVSDSAHNVKLADGSSFNIGLDGKTKYKNLGQNVDGKTERNSWDVDWSNPLAKHAVSLVDPIVRKNFQDGEGVRPEQYTGMLVNAISNNAKSEQDVLANMRSVFGGSQFKDSFPGAPDMAAPSERVQRPGKGQVARVSPGMYMNDAGQIVRSADSKGAMRQSYQIPRSRRK